MADSVTIDFSKPIPLFPLGTAALLPYATVPLHVFEPRYRAMMSDVLEEGEGLIAMAVYEGDAWKEEYAGRPPVRRHVCVGRVLRHEKTVDGRYHVLLQGVCRARIRREIHHEPYRVALLEPTETNQPMEIDLEERRRGLVERLEEPVLDQLAAVKAVRKWVKSDLPTPAMIDVSVLALSTRGEERYLMLAEADPRVRADWLEAYLDHLKDLLEMARELGDATTDEGWHLN